MVDDAAWDARTEELDAALDELVDELQPGEVAFGEVDEKGRWTGALVVCSGEGDVVPVGDDLGLPARLTIRRGTTTVVVDSSGGRPVYTVTVQATSPNLLNRLHLRSLVEQAVERVAVATRSRPRFEALDKSRQSEFTERYGVMAPGERVGGREVAKRFVRSTVTDRDVERAAEAYRDGGIDEVRRVMHVGERQAWRYVSRAQEAKLLPRQRKRRKQSS